MCVRALACIFERKATLSKFLPFTWLFGSWTLCGSQLGFFTEAPPHLWSFDSKCFLSCPTSRLLLWPPIPFAPLFNAVPNTLMSGSAGPFGITPNANPALCPLGQGFGGLAPSWPYMWAVIEAPSKLWPVCVLSCLLFMGMRRAGLTWAPAGSAVSISKCNLLPSSEKCQWSKPGIWDQKKEAGPWSKLSVVHRHERIIRACPWRTCCWPQCPAPVGEHVTSFSSRLCGVLVSPASNSPAHM